MATISDSLTATQFLLGNRVDIDSRIIKWLADAYKELGTTIPFETLEETKTDAFVVNQSDYPYPTNARGVKALTGFVQNAPYPIMKTDIRVISRYGVTVPGVPAIWAPYKGSIIVRPVPNQAYAFEWRYWIRPVIATDAGTTVLAIPDDWIEVVEHMAAYRGCIPLGESQRAREINILLHGDPKHPELPGMIKAKLIRDQAEQVVSHYGMNPRIRHYTYAR